MNRLIAVLPVFWVVLPISADTIILHDGSSYPGQFTGASSGMVTFTDGQGVQYRFPLADVQSLVYTPAADIVTLRTGKVYSGRYTGANPISFQDPNGIQYRFPVKDVASLVLARSRPAPAPVAATGDARVIPEGTPLSIRADESIDSTRSAPGVLYPATISEDVLDSTGAVAITAGAQAMLMVRNITTGGATHSPELVLDLFSVIGDRGKAYQVVTSDVDVSNRQGVGGNRRTAEYAAGGSGLGVLVGAIVGGGKGAAVGAGAGGAGGLVTQIFTRGKAVEVPAESVMIFRLDRTLVLRPKQ